MIDAYLGEIAQAPTTNRINRVHLTMEIQFTPLELCSIIDGVRERGVKLPEPCVLWLSRMDTMLRGSGRPVQPYVRTPVTSGAAYFAAPGSDAERAGRTLAFTYTGDANRLMMSLALFLQHCPADRYEFLVLFDAKRMLYLGGIPGLGADLPTTIDAIGKRFPPARFRRAISFGVSAGGLASVWTGVALGLERAVSVGGVTPDLVATRHQTTATDVSGFEAAIRKAPKLPDVVLVSGEGYQRDIDKATEMMRRLPGTSIHVPGSSSHNVLYDVYMRGELDALLERLLGEPSTEFASWSERRASTL